MFIWDFVAATVMDNMIDWFYGQVVGFLGNFFAEMGNMGVELFNLEWVQAIILFFSQLGWALFGVSLVVSGFECGIEYSSGRGNIQQTAFNAIKGFLAVSLFTTVPVRLYSLSVSLQGALSAGITGYGTSIGEVGQEIITELQAVESISVLPGGSTYLGLLTITSPIMILFCVILMAYAVIKVFFCQPEAWRYSAHSNRGRRTVYVLYSPWLHRRFCPMDETGHWPVSNRISAIDYSDSRAYGV